MLSFFHVVFSFPTAIFTVLLSVCMVLWLLSAIGLFDFDFGADLDVGDVGDIGDVGDVSAVGNHGALSMPDHVHSDHGAAQAVGILSRLGLNGVPITIVVTLISLVGWIVSYFAHQIFLGQVLNALVYYTLGIAIFAGAFCFAVWVTSLACKPLRKVFKQYNAVSQKHLVGQTVIVRTLKVTMTFGEGLLKHDGADLILKIRAPESSGFKKDDAVVLLEYMKDKGAYLVISEEEFKGLEQS